MCEQTETVNINKTKKKVPRKLFLILLYYLVGMYMVFHFISVQLWFGFTPVMLLDWTLRDLIDFFVDMIYPMSFFILLLLLIPVLFIPKPWAYSVQKIMIPVTFLIEALLLLTMRLYIDAHTIVFLIVSGLGLKALYSDDVWRYYLPIPQAIK